MMSCDTSVESARELLESVASRQSLMGRRGKVFNSLGGQSTRNNLYALHALMRDVKPQRTLEIGLCFGASALVIAASHRDAGKPPRGQHIAIDPYQSSVWDDSGRLSLERAQLTDYVTVMEAFSDAALPRLVEDGCQVELAYVDGSHLMEDVFIDFYYVNLLLRKGGIVLFDDSTDRHVRKVLRFIRRNRGDAYEQVDLSRYRHTPTLTYRIADRLGRCQLTAFRKVGETRRAWDSLFCNF